MSDLLVHSVAEGPGYAVVSVAGEIDVATVSEFRGALVSVLSRGVLRIAVDLARVTFMGSMGVGVLMGMHRVLAAEGGSLVLASPRGEVAQVLSLLGVSEVIPVAASATDAIARWIPDGGATPS